MLFSVEQALVGGTKYELHLKTPPWEVSSKRTGLKFDLGLVFKIFERLGVKIFVRLKWFRVSGEPKSRKYPVTCEGGL